MNTYCLSFRKVHFFLIILAVFMLVTSSYAGEKPHHETQQPAMAQFYDVVREAAPGLPGYTVYRPANLELAWGIRGKLPVVAWGNGGCRITNDDVTYFLTQIAAHGFVVVAVGDSDCHKDPTPPGVFNVPGPEPLLKAITWATSRPGHGGPWYSNQLDKSKIVVMGWSCGGIQALEAGADPRVRSVVALNTGFFAAGEGLPGYNDRSLLALLHTPVLVMDGGPTDIAYANSVANYDLLTVPAAHAEYAFDADGHVRFYYPSEPTRNITLQALEAVVSWLDGTLNGNKESLKFLVGPNPGLGLLPGWTVQSKNF
jgi:hypothetical protein